MNTTTFNDLKVNFHFTECCNFRCKFCFAPFASKVLPFDTLLQVVNKIAESKSCTAINFAGGEPTIDGRLAELIQIAHKSGLNCSLITNGYNLTDNLLADILPHISKIGFSAHSFNEETKKAIMSCTNDFKTLTNNRLNDLCNQIVASGYDCKIKVNTVVCSLNKDEEMVSSIMQLPLTQWKILRCQKNARNASMTISDDEFEMFCNRNLGFKGTTIENDMQNTYIIINPQGDLVFNSGMKYTKCGNVLTDNIDELLVKYPLRIDEYNKREKYFCGKYNHLI